MLESGRYSFFHDSVAKYSSILNFAKTAIPGRFPSSFKKNIFLTLWNAIGVKAEPKTHLRRLSGGALIIVLIFSTLIALLFVSIMESSLLQLKMVSNFQLMKKAQQEAQMQLILLEDKLKNYFHQEPLEHTTFIQFVPDTLLFGETQGTDYYRIKVENEQESGAYYQIVTTYGVRHG